MLPPGSSVLEILDNKVKDYKYMIISNNKEIEFYKANGWANIKLYYHGELIEMNEKYLDCEVKEDFSPSYDIDPITGEINFDSMYVDIELADDVVI